MWANGTCLRLNLLAWGGRCPVARWLLSFRPAEGGAWADLPADGESAQVATPLFAFTVQPQPSRLLLTLVTVQVGDLRPGAWYEVRVVARSPAGDSAALYRVATRTLSGGESPHRHLRTLCKPNAR